MSRRSCRSLSGRPVASPPLLRRLALGGAILLGGAALSACDDDPPLYEVGDPQKYSYPDEPCISDYAQSVEAGAADAASPDSSPPAAAPNNAADAAAVPDAATASDAGALLSSSEASSSTSKDAAAASAAVSADAGDAGQSCETTHELITLFADTTYCDHLAECDAPAEACRAGWWTTDEVQEVVGALTPDHQAECLGAVKGLDQCLVALSCKIVSCYQEADCHADGCEDAFAEFDEACWVIPAMVRHNRQVDLFRADR